MPTAGAWPDPRTAWNELSRDYQARHQVSTDSAHYGPWSPLERDLGLLGDVRGKQILDLGCGGGQCSIAFAKAGAHAVGVDPSDKQLDFARQLAAAEGVAVQFVQGKAEDLGFFATGVWDIVFSVYALHYVPDLPRCFAECARVLRPQGLLVFSTDHPFRNCFYDAGEDELTIYPVRSYFDNSPLRWPWAGRPEIRLHSAHYTIAQWLDLLHAAGFRLRRLLEPPPPPELLDEIWPADDALAAMRCVPQTLIIVAEKA